jgi:hypothetical protein
MSVSGCFPYFQKKRSNTHEANVGFHMDDGYSHIDMAAPSVAVNCYSM